MAKGQRNTKRIGGGKLGNFGRINLEEAPDLVKHRHKRNYVSKARKGSKPTRPDTKRKEQQRVGRGPHKNGHRQRVFLPIMHLTKC